MLPMGTATRRLKPLVGIFHVGVVYAADGHCDIRNKFTNNGYLVGVVYAADGHCDILYPHHVVPKLGVGVVYAADGHFDGDGAIVFSMIL